jgi:sec-independent protein translocase protein TatC
MTDKDKNQIPEENTDPQEPDDEGTATPTEDDSIPESDETGPIKAEDKVKPEDKVEQKDDEPADTDSSKDDNLEKTADDSIEDQDGYEDYYEGYGEEYYTSDPYGHDKAKHDSDSPEKSDSDNGGDDGGDDDDDDEEEIPEDNPEKKMPFLEHLEELRWTLMRSLIAIVIGAIICFFFSEYIIAALKALAPEGKMTLVILGPTDGFITVVKVAMFSGLVLALPFVAYEFWKFVVPGLLQKEKKLVPPIVFFTVVCFLAGAAFAYFVILNFALDFLLNFLDQTENMIAVGKYLGFVVTIILVFGVVFELPVLSFFLSSVGLLTPEFLRNNRRYGIVIIFIMAALLTPPDLSTQLLLAGPLIILYEISIWVSALVVRRKKEKEDEEDDD